MTGSRLICGMKAEYLVTIGTFDGVHRGHRKLLRWVRMFARRLGLRTRVVFFAVPPRFFLKPSLSVPLLTTSRERSAILKRLGVDRVQILRFGPRWAHMEHTRFFEEYIVRRWKAGGLLVGRDFAFGRGRKGDLAYLRGACASRRIHLDVLPLVRVRGKKISSSDIRALLEAGRVDRAADLLGRPFQVAGRVVHGQGLGRRLGCPTANLRLPKEHMVPPGVFRATVHGPGLHAMPAVCNVGRRPTIRGGRHRLVTEVHILDWSGDLYGKTLRVEFLERLRGEKKFKDLGSLKAQIAKDVARATCGTGCSAGCTRPGRAVPQPPPQPVHAAGSRGRSSIAAQV